MPSHTVRRFTAIAAGAYLMFLAEFALYNIFGAWGKPQLMLLFIIFCTLYWGIRYSLCAAAVAGLLKDAFGIEPFGTYLLIYVAAAYLTVWFRRNVYQPGSRFSRAVVAFLVLLAVFVMEFLLHARFFEVRWAEAVRYIFLPQVLVTMMVATMVFQYFRDLAVKHRL